MSACDTLRERLKIPLAILLVMSIFFGFLFVMGVEAWIPMFMLIVVNIVIASMLAIEIYNA